MKSILVTGAAGFVGANLVRRLLHENAQIHVIVRPNSNLWRLEEVLSFVVLHYVDLEDFDRLNVVIGQIKPKVIFHLAAVGVIEHDHSSCNLIGNLQATFHLLKACQEIDYELFVYMGSSLGYENQTRPMVETDVLKPTSIYGLSKACCSLLCQQFQFEYQRPITELRVFSVYGPYESEKRLIPRAIEAAMRGIKLPLTEPGYARDFIFVEDVAKACILCWKEQVKGEIINVGTGKQTTNEGVVALIEELTGKPIKFEIGAFPKRLTDKSSWRADITKAKRLLHFEPVYDLISGLKKTIKYYVEHYSSCIPK